MNAIAHFDPKSNSGISGYISFTQQDPKHPVQVEVVLSGFQKKSIHAFHIHEFGNLTRGCASTGKHFNPSGVRHGSRYTPSRHAGDLINNLFTNESGVVNIRFTDENISLFPNSKYSIIGRAVVIHRDPDDYGLGGHLTEDGFRSYASMTASELRALSKDRGYPTRGTREQLQEKLELESTLTGNAGGRIACAVIGIAS